MKSITMAPERVEYLIWKFSNNGPELNIDGDDLVYSQLGEFHHGVQCNHFGRTNEHDLITKKCSQIIELFKEINELNKSCKL